MTVYIKNQLDSAYDGPAIAILGLGADLDPKGQDDWFADVTSEIVGLSSADYLTLQSEQMSSKVLFSKDPTDIIATPGLEIRSSQETYDTAMDPRGATLTPTSPAIFDSSGQTLRAIFMDGTEGAFEVDIFGSIDTVNLDPLNKAYRYISRFSAGDPGLHQVPDEIIKRLGKYRWTKVEPVRGVKPEISFQANF